MSEFVSAKTGGDTEVEQPHSKTLVSDSQTELEPFEGNVETLIVEFSESQIGLEPVTGVAETLVSNTNEPNVGFEPVKGNVVKSVISPVWRIRNAIEE